MKLEADLQLLHYRLVEKLGEGGMGEVWKATDTILDREVALKCLPEAFATDAERRARFAREAKLLASFNHPNIAGIHGLHECDGLRFLTMELVPGEDLSAALRRGPLPVGDVHHVGLAIAQALEQAHEVGIIHRDLKPANVRWTPQKEVKVLDFGLAKALESQLEAPASSYAPTITSGGTRAGMVLGTAAYMSPEQARGEVVDRRTDIWAFGCLLYELLTRRLAFPGQTVTDTYVAILEREPEWDALPKNTPAATRTLLHRCLVKDPRRRLRDIGEARILLEDAIDGRPEAVDEARNDRRTNQRRLAVYTLAVATLSFVVGYLLQQVLRVPAAPPLNPDLVARQLTFDEGVEYEPDISSDGNYVAYTTDRSGNLDIAVLPLAGGNVNLVVDHPADDAQPRWSPDGSRLAFVSARDHSGLLSVVGGLGDLSNSVMGTGGDIFLMPASGGTASKLVDLAMYPTWSPDGSELAFQSNRDAHWDIWKIAATGGDPVRLTNDEAIDYQPAWSPDGQWIAFASADIEGGPTGLCVVPADGGSRILLYRGGTLTPMWSVDGNWIYFAADRAPTSSNVNLWRIPFRPEGDPVEVPQRVTVGSIGDFGPTTSTDGRLLVYSQMSTALDIWKLDVRSGALTQITRASSREQFPSLHPDGRRLAFSSDRAGVESLWVQDLQNGSTVQVDAPGRSADPQWSPDGSTLTFTHGPRIAIQRWGDVKTTDLTPTAGSRGARWSPDGRRIAFYGQGGISVREADGAITLLVEDELAMFPTWSPDGRTIAFQRDTPSSDRELWAVPSSGGEPWLIAGGRVEYSHPVWNPVDPDEILVIVDHKDLALISASTGKVERITHLAASTVIVDYASWAPDGQSIFFTFARRSADLHIIEGM